ncbi:MAG: hypothetical protein WBA74_22780, partial [Cyclobacteriaceae bacterium]
ASGFSKSAEDGNFSFFFGEEDGGEQQVFLAIDEEISTLEEIVTGTYEKKSYVLKLQIDGMGTKELVSPELYLEEYNNIILRYSSSEISLVINGEEAGRLEVPGLLAMIKSADEMAFGSFAGHLDEVLVWSSDKTIESIAQDYNRYLTGGETDLMAYWRIDEGIGSATYDAAYTLDATRKKSFGERHAYLTGSPIWSTVVPEQEELSFTAYTDKEGNYNIQSIIYANAGNNFKVVPIFGSHQFSPVNEVLFIGKTNASHDRINFTDVSSFTVTGTVKYAPTILGFESNDDDNAPNCYVEDVDILLDGRIILSDGEQVKTDKNGRFEIQVPIGKHTISVSRQNHTFVSEVWPPTGDFDFQQDQFDLVFFDNTTRKVIGKVVGGVTEGSKESGSALMVNNIGITAIKLKSIGKSCFETVIETDSLTGEYYAELPPFRYNVVDLNIKSQSANFNRSFRKLATSTINLDRDELSLNTVPCQNSDLCTTDSYDYHLKRDFIYYNPPEILVVSDNPDDFTLLGNSDWTNDLGEDIDISAKPLPYEVFTTGDTYRWNIAMIEKYINYDVPFSNPLKSATTYRDTIRSGKVLVDNDIAGETVELDLQQGKIQYVFNAGESSILMDRQKPENSFTQSVQISGRDVSWEPNGEIFRGYVLGSVQDKTQRSFYTVSK